MPDRPKCRDSWLEVAELARGLDGEFRDLGLKMQDVGVPEGEGEWVSAVRCMFEYTGLCH